MWKLRRFFAPDGEGAGGGSAADSSSGTPPADAGKQVQGGSDGGAGGSAAKQQPPAGAAGDPKSILDMAKPAEPDKPKPAQGTVPYDPGKLPDGVLGKTDKETIDNLHARYTEARREISKRQASAAGDVPDKPEGYAFAKQGDKDPIFDAVTSKDGKAVDDVVRAACQAAGIGQKQYEALVRTFYERGGEVGMFLSVEEAQEVSGKAELAELVKMTGSEKAANEIIRTVKDYGQRLVERGIMPKADLAEWGTMFGTARASNIMFRILTELAGIKPVPLTGTADADAYSTEDLYAMRAAMNRMKPGPEREAERKRVEALFEQHFGTGRAASSTEAKRAAAR